MPMKPDTPMPSFEAASDWFNGPLANDSLAGNPTLVHIWSVSCGICCEQMPDLNRLRQTYGPRGLNMVAVHKPRSEKDTELARIEQSIRDNDIQHPVAVDNTHKVCEAFRNGKGVPEYFLFDANRRLRLNVIGDQGLANLEKMIVLLMRAAQLQKQA